jgi:hypothetical protein
MKKCSGSCHNLNIQMYSFNEILSLFDLHNINHITEEEMKKAKMLVLKTHPDKSRLPPEYFIFYKKAFEIIVNYYNNQNKTNAKVPHTKQNYNQHINNDNFHTDENVLNTIETMKPEVFQKTFNELFEQNNMGRKIVNKNEWFSKDDPPFDISLHNKANTVSAIHSNFEKIKQQQKQNEIVVFKQLQELPLNTTLTSGDLYEDIDDISNNDVYIESNPFSKLRFEDLKKVHKNETIFQISEAEYKNIPKYDNVEHYENTRNSVNYNLPSKDKSEQILKEQQENIRSNMLKKEFALKKKQAEYEQKNKSVLSYFLQIQN